VLGLQPSELLDKPHVALAVRLTDSASPAVVSQQLSVLLPEPPSLQSGDQERVLVLVAAAGALAEPAERAFVFRQVHEALEASHGTVTLGWSRLHAGPRGWRRALTEAEQALAMIERIFGLGNAGGFAEVGILSLVLGRHDPDHVRVLQEGLLGPLFRHDLTDHTDLVATLETYLDAACNGIRTAEVLHVHRNSANYRLQRIKELAEVDLDDPDTRLLVQLILRTTRGLCEQTQPGEPVLAQASRPTIRW
jgi:DNA-binding PucR family transcriptional regulator